MVPTAVVSVESREAHLSSLVVEAEQRAADLAAQAQRDGLSLEACHKDKQLRAWEWRSKLYKRMRTGFQHACESPPTHPTPTLTQESPEPLLDVMKSLLTWTGGVCELYWGASLSLQLVTPVGLSVCPCSGAPEAPSMVRLSVSSSSTLTVIFQEPQCLNSTVVTRYRGTSTT